MSKYCSKEICMVCGKRKEFRGLGQAIATDRGSICWDCLMEYRLPGLYIERDKARLLALFRERGYRFCLKCGKRVPLTKLLLATLGEHILGRTLCREHEPVMV